MLSRTALGGLVATFFFLWYILISQPESGPVQAHRNDGDLANILNETLGFQKIYVINLPHRSDKRDAMSIAGRLTGLKFEYIDAVTSVNSKALPPADEDLTAVKLATWRSHMNALRRIVEEGVTSALILEDDVDWDVRIKAQMQDFAKASRLLLQPIRGSNNRSFVDPTFHSHAITDTATDFDLSKLSQTVVPSTSPYGDLDRWDMLWLGHCGTQFPWPKDEMPLGRVIFPDETVPETHHLTFHFGKDELARHYPNHTRGVSRSRKTMCSLAYGLSLEGATRFLADVGLQPLTVPHDMLFSGLCDAARGKRLHRCLTPQPQYFEHHRPAGSKTSWSDIDPKMAGHNGFAFTRNIRWSTRLNWQKLLYGDAGEFVDLFKDGEETPDLGDFE